MADSLTSGDESFRAAKTPSRLVIDLDADKRQRLKIIAAVRGTTIRALVESAIDELIAAHPDMPYSKK